jgi:hypothetical protein
MPGGVAPHPLSEYGSQRCGMIGTVKKIISGSSATVWLDYDKSLSFEWRELVSALKDLELIVLNR